MTATLTAGQPRRLSAALSQAHGHEVYLNVVLDPRRRRVGAGGRRAPGVARDAQVTTAARTRGCRSSRRQQ